MASQPAKPRADDLSAAIETGIETRIGFFLGEQRMNRE
jgi:hypothetical protein